MKRVCVCFKIVEDFDEVLPSDWETADGGGPDISYLRRALGEFDEAALENGLLLKDAFTKLGFDARLTALTVASGCDDHIFKNFAALGVDRAVRIETREDLRFRPRRTAALLADFIKNDGIPDVILAGVMTPPGESGMVPLLLAEYLGLPCVTDIISLRPAADCVAVENRVEGGICRREATAAFLCTVGNAERSYLRIPTLRETLRAPALAVESIEAEGGEDGVFGPVAAFREDNDRSCLFADGADAAARAAFLYERVIKGVLT